MSLSNVKIVLPLAGHTCGLEYNYNPENHSDEAMKFVFACNTLLNKRCGWFHQSGAFDENCQYNPKGYQFFEALGQIDDETLISEGEKIAKELGVILEI